MADIELVIKIPEEVYNLLKNDRVDWLGAEHIIANGTPLPKGHGDLKDMNDLCAKSRYGCKGNCDYLHTCNLYSEPTIIEADTESGREVGEGE